VHGSSHRQLSRTLLSQELEHFAELDGSGLGRGQGPLACTGGRAARFDESALRFACP
jgi:hypothetical protein